MREGVPWCPLCEDVVADLGFHVAANHTEWDVLYSAYKCFCKMWFVHTSAMERHWDEEGGLEFHILESRLK